LYRDQQARTASGQRRLHDLRTGDLRTGRRRAHRQGRQDQVDHHRRRAGAVSRQAAEAPRVERPPGAEPVSNCDRSRGTAVMVRLRGIVRGRVQGVGYRYFAHHAAERLHVAGVVRNLPDGSVEVEAEAPDRLQLEALLRELRTGPSASEVEDVEATWEED